MASAPHTQQLRAPSRSRHALASALAGVAAKADQHGDVLGLGGCCHGLFFSLSLSARTRGTNSIATLELMAL
eukprot:1202174-Pleurochrysis_carterae.AAC.1